MLTISYEVGARSYGKSTEKQADHNSQYGASHHNCDGRDKPPPFRPKCADETHGQILHRSPSNCCNQALSLIDLPQPPISDTAHLQQVMPIRLLAVCCYSSSARRGVSTR